MKKFTAKPICAGKSVDKSSRVIAIQIDAEVPAHISSDDVIDFLESRISNATFQPFHIAGIDVVEDLTDVYEKNYPDLLVYR